MMDFHFIRPQWLLGLVAAAWLLWATSRNEDLRRKWGGIIARPLLDHLIIPPGATARFRPVHLTVAMIALSSLSAAGPAWQREQPPFVEDRAPLVIAIDLSKDMDAIDVTPSRLERAKLKVHDLLALRNGARTSVIAYAGSAHVVMPLTDDPSLLQTYTDALATNVMPRAGRNLPAAITAAKNVLARETTPGTLLFLTSGVDAGDTEAIKALQAAGQLQPLVVGIGLPEGGLDVQSFRRLHDQAGVPVATVTTDASDVEWIQRRVQSHLQARTIEENQRWKDEGWWLTIPLALGSALWFRKGWTLRWSAAAVFVLLLSTPAPASAQGQWWDDLWWTRDQQGQRAFDRGEYATAADRFVDPFHKAGAFYKAGKFTETLFWFQRVDTPESDYNQGNALAHLGKLPEAVARYEAALKRRPDFPDARANLELVKKLIPKQKKDDEQQGDPAEKPDEMKFDDKGKKGKAGRVEGAAQTADMWMRNIQTTPAGLLKRRFAIEAAK